MSANSLRNYKLKVWRQKSAKDKGHFQEIDAKGISEHQSFLEMLDSINLEMVKKGEDPIVFDHDCREGICGSCDLVINGNPHGPDIATATCQLHMRRFKDGETIVVEPFRAKPFPVIKDLSVNRTALDEIIAAGGYITVRTGAAPDANAIPVRKENADIAFDAAACIGCGACVAACNNASAMLFTAAKISHLYQYPQGKPEHRERVLNMVEKMDELGFGNCSNTGACTLACPKEISLEHIGRLHREYPISALKSRPVDKDAGGAE